MWESEKQAQSWLPWSPIKNMVELHQMIINGWEKSPMGVGQCLNMSQKVTVQTRKQHVGPRAHLGGNRCHV